MARGWVDLENYFDALQQMVVGACQGSWCIRACSTAKTRPLFALWSRH